LYSSLFLIRKTHLTIAGIRVRGTVLLTAPAKRTVPLTISASLGAHITKFDNELDLNKAVNYADKEMYKMKKQSRS
jgi:hypothetical protein